MAVPIVLLMFSFLSENTSTSTDQKEVESTKVLSKMIEVPNYTYSIEFQLAAQKTFMEEFDTPITEEMISKPLVWLGYCYETNDDSKNLQGFTSVKCGDKIEWGGKVYCLLW